MTRPTGTPTYLNGVLLSVPVGLIDPHPDNVRKTLGDLHELARSITVAGVLQPLLVQATFKGRYLLLDGHRRFAAAKLAGRKTVPCLLRREDLPDEHLPLMLVANLQRAELSPLEQANACQALTGMGLTQPEIARRVGKSVAWVGDRLALLALPAEARHLVETHVMTIGDAADLGRQVRRQGHGHTNPEPRARAHFTATHRLARDARLLCDQAEHPARGRVGAVACGACWETAIRADHQGAVA